MAEEAYARLLMLVKVTDTYVLRRLFKPIVQNHYNHSNLRFRQHQVQPPTKDVCNLIQRTLYANAANAYKNRSSTHQYLPPCYNSISSELEKLDYSRYTVNWTIAFLYAPQNTLR